MLMKLTPGVNFTYILQADFWLVPICQKIQTETKSTEKLRISLSNKKAAQKLLMKLAPAQNKSLSLICHLSKNRRGRLNVFYISRIHKQKCSGKIQLLLPCQESGLIALIHTDK